VPTRRYARIRSCLSSALDAAAFARLASALPQAPTSAFVFTPTPFGAYSRMFAPILGSVEDPAAGSATGPPAAYMLDDAARLRSRL